MSTFYLHKLHKPRSLIDSFWRADLNNKKNVLHREKWKKMRFRLNPFSVILCFIRVQFGGIFTAASVSQKKFDFLIMSQGKWFFFSAHQLMCFLESSISPSDVLESSVWYCCFCSMLFLKNLTNSMRWSEHQKIKHAFKIVCITPTDWKRRF